MPDPAGPAVCCGPARGLPPVGGGSSSCLGGLQRHHIVNRPKGTAEQLDTPENLAWLCAGHHDYVETHPNEARAAGLKRYR